MSPLTPRFRYKSTKTYEHSVGLSCCFRQWKAQSSHCRFLHGYALQVKMVFTAEKLDDRGWVVDFGGLGAIKALLVDLFDHKLLVAEDDPFKDNLVRLGQMGLAQVVVLSDIGCEAFAWHIYEIVDEWLHEQYVVGSLPLLESVEVREHGGNSAIYERVS